MLCDVNVIGVGDVALIGDALDHTKALLQTLGKFIGSALNRSTVERIVDILSGFPCSALVVHVLHNLESKRFAVRVGMALASHRHNTFVQTGITQRDGGIAAVKQLVDGFTLFQAGQSAILPVDRRSIGQGTAQTLVTDLQRLMTQLQPLIENLPEGVIQILDVVMVAGCLPNFQSAQSNIGEVDGDDSLVETSVPLPWHRAGRKGVYPPEQCRQTGS